MSRLRAGRLVVVVTGLGIVMLWAVLALGGREGGMVRTAGPPFWVVWMIFTTLAVMAAVGAWRRSPLVALTAGFVSLVPVGLYFLVLPGVFRWIGILNVVLVVGAGAEWLRVRGGEERGGE